MNRVRQAASAALSNIGSAFTSLAGTAVQRLSLVPPFLTHLLWLLSQKFVDLAREGYGQNAAVYACLRFLCTAVGEPPMLVYHRQPDGTPDLTEPLDYAHPLRQLLTHPNPYLTEYEHYELITLHMGITGRYVCWQERTNGGDTKALWPLRPDRVGPIYGDAMKGEPLLLGWSYLVPGTVHYIGIPAADCIMLNFPDPLGESGGLVEGLGPLQVLAIEVGADLEASRFVGNMVSNYAQPGLVVQVKRGLTTPEDAKLIKQGFIEQFGGRRRGEPAVIDADSTIVPTGFSLQQLEFTALRRVSESRIAGAFGVPAILAGLLVGLDASSTNATVDELRAMFSETTLSNYWHRYADGFTNQLAIEYDENLVCAFDLTQVQALAGRAASRLKELSDGFDRGVVQVAEYREALGLEDDGKGDVYVFGIAPGRGSQVVIDPSTVNAGNAADSATAVDQAAATALPDNGNGAPPPPAKAVIDPHIRKAIAEGVATALNRGEPDVRAGKQALDSLFAEIMATIEPEKAAANGHKGKA